MLEIILSFVTNSLSYLRVGGFVLSHAGMMLVVMTLVKMTGNAGPVVFVLGNLFVMGLEGLILHYFLQKAFEVSVKSEKSGKITKRRSAACRSGTLSGSRRQS